MIDIGILTVISTIFLFMFARSAVRLTNSVKNKEESIGLRVAALIMWLVMLFGSSFFEFKHQLAHFVATDVTREVSGKDDSIAQCRRRSSDSFDFMKFGYAGFVSSDNMKISRLRTDTCSDFAYWILSNKKHANRDEIIALEVIIHEAVHVGGEYDEAVTECKAMDKYEEIAVKLGASSEEAARMLNEYRNNIHPYMPKNYIIDCSKI